MCCTLCAQERVEQKRKLIRYVKIHVPWETLSVYAEYLLLRAPIQVSVYDVCQIHTADADATQLSTVELSRVGVGGVNTILN